MHLTNYAVNKHNENFVTGPEADSSKWDFATLRYPDLPLVKANALEVAVVAGHLSCFWGLDDIETVVCCHMEPLL